MENGLFDNYLVGENVELALTWHYFGISKHIVIVLRYKQQIKMRHKKYLISTKLFEIFSTKRLILTFYILSDPNMFAS
jgi:hypothetical protein